MFWQQKMPLAGHAFPLVHYAQQEQRSTVNQDQNLVSAQRGPLHLVRAEDYWWLHPLTTPQLRTGNSRRLAQEGVPPQDAERAVDAVQAVLAAGGRLTRSELRERVAAAGVRTEGQAMVHILALASIRGLIVRGPVAGRDQAFVLARDWLGTPPPAMSREAALGELARRYLAGHAPAADRDLAQWAGIRLADARLGLARCGAIQRADGLAEPPANPRRAAAALPPPLLLGAFEPLLLGWASRDPIVGPHRRIVTVNGLFRPFALARGRAVATWNIAGGQVVLTPFAPLDTQTQWRWPPTPPPYAVPRRIGPPGRPRRLAGAGPGTRTAPHGAPAVRLRSRMAAGPSSAGPAALAMPGCAGYWPEKKAAALRAISSAGTSSMCWLIIHCWPNGSRSRPPRSP